MANIFVLIILLVIMSGFVAFIGDRLGTIIGKKRLSIFGTRPRRTGQIIGVLAGIAIMLITIAALALVNRGAVQTIIRAQEAAAEIRHLRAERDNLNANLSSLNIQLNKQKTELLKAKNQAALSMGQLDIARDERDKIRQEKEQLAKDVDNLASKLKLLETQKREFELANKELSKQNTTLEAENQELLSEKADLVSENKNLQNLNDSLKAQIDATNTQVVELDSRVNELNSTLGSQAELLTALESQLRSINDAGLSYRKNEIIYSGVIKSQNRNEIRSELSNLLTEANNKALERGAGEVIVKSEQFDALVNDILKTPREDIVTLRSPKDFFGVSDISVAVENYENTRILKDGSLLVSKKIFIDNDSTESSVRADIAKLVSDAKTQLVLKGLAVKPAIEDLNAEGFAKQLLRMNGAITIALMADEDILASGPAKLKLAIIY